MVRRIKSLWSDRTDYRGGNRVLIGLFVWVLAAFIGVSVCFAEEQISSVTQIDTFSSACQSVYEGKFQAAAEGICGQTGEQFEQLAAITAEYSSLEASRAQARKETFDKQWKKLQSLRWGTDPNDANDVNEPASVFAVSLSLLRIASDSQKQQVMNTAILKEAVEKAKAKAAQHEQAGEWIDAYTSCWYWLTELDEDNIEYKNKADDLIEQANILGSFQDSPCETRRARFDKVEPTIFKRAIEEIDRTYVNPAFVDYSQMALKSIRRSRLLSEVVINSYDKIEESQSESDEPVAFNEMLYKPSDEGIRAWLDGLEAIEHDVEQSPNGITKERFIDVFDQILLLNSTTVMLPKSILIAHLSEASLGVLDKHTMLVWPKDVKDFNKELTNEFSGIGILISRERGLLKAASLLPDTPAYRSGLDAGDIIEKVDDVSTEDMSLECAVKRITGPSGTDVKLTVRTPGKDTTHDLIITRGRIVVQTIRGWKRDTNGDWEYMIDDDRKIGYVKITGFSEKTASDFEKTLNMLEQQGMTGLVIDLRNNPGGLLDSARDICDNFVRKGLIVRTQPRWGIPAYLHASSFGTHPDYPLVVLVNRFSASASEIVAGALQDPKYKRAVIVGEQTYGKGSVQQLSYRPGGGAQLKYTVAYYHLPSGQRVLSQDEAERNGSDKWGIIPDVTVELTPEEMGKLTDVQRDNDVLVKADHDVDKAPVKKLSIAETLEADSQLKVALLIIKTKLLEQGRAMAAAEMCNN